MYPKHLFFLLRIDLSACMMLIMIKLFVELRQCSPLGSVSGRRAYSMNFLCPNHIVNVCYRYSPHAHSTLPLVSLTHVNNYKATTKLFVYLRPGGYIAREWCRYECRLFVIVNLHTVMDFAFGRDGPLKCVCSLLNVVAIKYRLWNTSLFNNYFQ